MKDDTVTHRTHHSGQAGYYTPKGPLIWDKKVTLTVDEAVEQVFTILNVRAPNSAQKRFAKAEIKIATGNGHFERLIFLLSSFMGCSDAYYSTHYTII